MNSQLQSSVIIFSLVILMSIFTACQKNPVASFDTDNEIYESGATVNLINKSTDGKKYKWTMPDGSISTQENAFFVLPPAYANSNQRFKLEVWGSNNRKYDVSNKIIGVKKATGSLMFWISSNSLIQNINVTINGITKYGYGHYVSEPDCGSSGTVTFEDLQEGNLYYSLTTYYNGVNSYTNGVATIGRGSCQKIAI